MFKLDAPEPDSDSRGPDLDESLPQVDLPLIMPDEMPTGRAPAPPQPPTPPAPPPSPFPPRPQMKVPKAMPAADDDGAADAAALSQAEPVLTETMAELYLKQGHPQDALRVYQALLAQRPQDARLRGRVEQLSSGGRKGSGVSAQAFLKGIWSGRTAPLPAQPPEQHSTLSAAFDVAGAGSQAPGEPSHPAHDHISLDSVFGEEVARHSNAQPAAEQPGATAAPGDKPSGGFSFDEFFAGGKTGAEGATPTPSDSARTPGPLSLRVARPL